ncbi:DUF3718 domain-containing protein [Thalassotalea sp. G2M2-11]|uniref:DUF3718 domain-containing protein n=1 Tax=Thalassotalea sp. G2M2-11 TaxID=2787627 RepID=UPI0019CF9F5B|nr:DUF3718 domain-containing protein [Thalassotalea sp. G2M2-11]
MNKHYLIICCIISLYLLPPQVNAFNIAQNICEYIAVDDKKRLRQLLKANHLKIRKLYSDISCNGKTMLEFSAERNAKEVSELIVKKLPKRILKESLPAIEASSPDIAKLIQERLQ